MIGSLLLSLAITCLGGPDDDPPSVEYRQPSADTVNRLATAMYAALAGAGADDDDKEPTNIVFSPLVSAAAFVELSAMTVGEARTEINRALGLTGAALATPATRALRSTALTIAAGLWRRKDRKIRIEFAATAAVAGSTSRSSSR